MITATLYGRISQAPERKVAQNGGKQYTRFSIAVNTGKKDQAGKQMAQFVGIVAFGKTGEVVEQYFHVGNRIVCHVRDLEAYAYVSQQGDARSGLNAVLVGVDFVDTKEESEQRAQAQPRPAAGYGQAPQGYAAPPAVPQQPYTQPQGYAQPQQQAPAPQAPPMPGGVPWQG